MLRFVPITRTDAVLQQCAEPRNDDTRYCSFWFAGSGETHRSKEVSYFCVERSTFLTSPFRLCRVLGGRLERRLSGSHFRSFFPRIPGFPFRCSQKFVKLQALLPLGSSLTFSTVVLLFANLRQASTTNAPRDPPCTSPSPDCNSFRPFTLPSFCGMPSRPRVKPTRLPATCTRAPPTCGGRTTP